MATKEPVLEVSFSGGIDESTRAELVDAAQAFPVLENVRQDKRGALSKRLGYDFLGVTRTDATTRSAGYKLFSSGQTACVTDGSTLDAYSENLGQWAKLGRVCEGTVSSSPLPALGGSFIVSDTILCGGVLCVLYEYVAGGYAFAALDFATGAALLVPQTISASASITYRGWLATFGTRVVVVQPGTAAGVAAANSIGCNIYDTSSPTTAASYLATLCADWFSTAASVCSLSDRAAIAYVNTSGGMNQLTVKTFDQTGVLTSTTINTNLVAPTDVDIHYTGTHLWVVWNEGADIKAIALNPSTLAVTGTKYAVASVTGVTYVAICESATAGNAVCWYWYGGTPQAVGAYGLTISAGAVTSSGVIGTAYNATLASRPFLRNGRYYALVGDSDGTTVVVCDVTPENVSQYYLRPIGAPIVRGIADDLGAPTRRFFVSGNKAYLGHNIKNTALTRVGNLACVDFASASRWQAVDHGGVTYLSGGVLSYVDGVQVCEAAVLHAPPTPTTSTSGTGITAVTGWRYVCVYECVDAKGNVTTSGVSSPSSSTGAVANKTVTVTTRTLSITSRGNQDTVTPSNVRVAFYRTLDGLSTYYRVGETAAPPGTAAITYADTTSDAVLASKALLYGTGSLPATNGSSQDHRAPPGLSCLVSYNGMLVGAQGRTLWFSSQLVSGETPWFSPVFTVQVDQDVTALTAQDGALYAFSRTAVFAVSGEPPSDNAAAGGLGTPRRLAADVGCIDQRSVVVTALGVFFQSARGIELLSRAQSVEWIGASVMDTLADYPVITSATVDNERALVRFTCAASETSNQVSATGVHLVFDLSLKLWVSVDKVTNGNNASRAAQSASMVYLGGSWRFGWLDKDGRVFMEELPASTTAHLDLRGTYWVTQAAETANVHVGGLQGQQVVDRILVLAEQHTAHDLTISVAHDYGSSYTESKTFPADLLATLGRQWLDRELVKSTGQAVRVRLADATPSSGTVGTGKGATWVALTFSGERRSGVRRTTSAERGT